MTRLNYRLVKKYIYIYISVYPQYFNSEESIYFVLIKLSVGLFIFSLAEKFEDIKVVMFELSMLWFLILNDKFFLFIQMTSSDSLIDSKSPLYQGWSIISL